MNRRSLLQTCADCHVKFPWFLAGLLCFDNEKGVYVCQRCRIEKGSKSGSNRFERFKSHPRSMFMFALVYSLMFLPVVIFGAVDIGRALYWNSLEVTPVDELPDSGTVKLLGVINESADSAAIGIRETDSEGGYSWEYDPDGGHFLFSDGTGTVNVSWEKWYEIEKGTQKEWTKHGEK